jgi:hypothetical protein
MKQKMLRFVIQVEDRETGKMAKKKFKSGGVGGGWG